MSNDYKRVKVTLYMGLKKCKNGKMIKHCKKVPLKLQSTGRKPAIWRQIQFSHKDVFLGGPSLARQAASDRPQAAAVGRQATAMEEPYFHLNRVLCLQSRFKWRSSCGWARRLSSLVKKYYTYSIALPFSPPAFCFATVAKSSRLQLVDIITMF